MEEIKALSQEVEQIKALSQEGGGDKGTESGGWSR